MYVCAFVSSFVGTSDVLVSQSFNEKDVTHSDQVINRIGAKVHVRRFVHTSRLSLFSLIQEWSDLVLVSFYSSTMLIGFRFLNQLLQ
jgi:hypothetical protein